MREKIIRGICYFSDTPDRGVLKGISRIAARLEDHGYALQTKRICFQGQTIREVDSLFRNERLFLSVGSLDRQSAGEQIHDFCRAENVAFHLDLSEGVVPKDTDLLFKIIEMKPEKTFSFAYTFRNARSSPFFPSAAYEKNGFSIGLQATDLAEGCSCLGEWLDSMKSVWEEICNLFQEQSDFLGIDSSVAPLFTGKGSLVNFIRRIGYSFPESTTRDVYLQISKYIRSNNPRPVGLCGLMFPCLEDFELAEEYDQGNFYVERNVYLSLHSGVGIDTYPIGIDESPARVFEILVLLKELSEKYGKPLSARFVSDGKARLGERTDFRNPYLKDVVVRPL